MAKHRSCLRPDLGTRMRRPTWLVLVLVLASVVVSTGSGRAITLVNDRVPEAQKEDTATACPDTMSGLRFYRGRTWYWQKRAGEPRTKASRVFRRDASCAYIRWATDLWRGRARLARARAEKYAAIAKRIDTVLTGYPLHGQGWAFERSGRKWNVSPYLLVAISGKESTFGAACYGFNCWGWGCPNNHCGYGFASYAHGIETVASGLRRNYLNHGRLSIAAIGSIYCAPPTAWISDVTWIMSHHFGTTKVTYR